MNSNRSRGSQLSLWIRSVVKQTTSCFSSSCLPVELCPIYTSSPRQAINVVRIQITRFLPNGWPLCFDIEEISLVTLFFAGGNVRRSLIIAAFLIVVHKHSKLFLFNLFSHQTSPDLLLDSAESYLVILTINSYLSYFKKDEINL